MESLEEQIKAIREAIVSGSSTQTESTREMTNSMKRLETQSNLLWKSAEQRSLVKGISW